MPAFSRRLTAAVAVAALVTAASCSNDGEDGGQDNNSSEPDQVTYMTSFGNFGRDAYAWVALEKGFFEEEGIEVEILPGLGGENLVHLTTGQADFVVSSINSALFTASEDESHGFTMLAAIYQNTLAGLMTLEENEIESPADLEGKTLADAAGSVVLTLFPTYADLAGIDADSVTIQTAQPQELPGLLAGGSADVIGQFAVGEPLIENAADGREAVYLPYSDYLTDLYGVMLYTTKEMTEQNPDLVERFRDALLRGLEYALEHPDETGEILAKHDETANAEVAAEEVRLLEPYVRPLEPGAPLGVIDRDRVARSIALMEAAGAIEPGLTPESLVSFDFVPGAEN